MAASGSRFLALFEVDFSLVAPAEIKYEFLSRVFFVVAVRIWSNRAVIRLNMHREVTSPPKLTLGGGVKSKKNLFHSLTFHEEKKSI